MECQFTKSVYHPKDLPASTYSEICLVGKSNCGKSSFLNILTERKNIARKSSTPGRTDGINFYTLKKDKNTACNLADLPGYGYSTVSQKVKDLWGPLLSAYLERPQLSQIFYLWDCRREPDDKEIQYLIDLSKKSQTHLVLTKCDKLKKSQLREKKNKTMNLLKSIGFQGKIYETSSLKKTGFKEIRDNLIWSNLSSVSK